MSSREYWSNHKQNMGVNIECKGHSNEISAGKEERAIGNWRKGNLCYKASKNLAELCS